MSQRVVLIVLDGWGHRREEEGNAIALARTPTWQRLVERSPMTLLDASGPAVGLPVGQMGNSEVGHLNLGAGRVVPQDIVRISESMDSGSFNTIPELVDLCSALRGRDGTLHIVGLLGTGGVHAVHRHLAGVLSMAKRQKITRVAIHAFLDGRDTLPRSAADFMRNVTELAQSSTQNGVPCVIASATGRYHAMDRDKRWGRTKLAYDAMVHGTGRRVSDIGAAIEECYARDESDEFIKPLVAQQDGKAVSTIRNGDGVFCLNFRADRMRQIVSALAIDGFNDFDTGQRPVIDLVTMTQYKEEFPFPTAFPPVTLARFMGEVVSNAGKTMFRTAETEKYAHVTYFFNCGIESPFSGEERELVASQRVATYDLQPEMSAPGITDVLCKSLKSGHHDFTLCNYANGDMVGHTGVIPATIKAVETVDHCLTRVLAAAETSGHVVFITADHGNCELMIDPETQGPHTAHTTNPVPFVMISPNGSRSARLRSGGCLSDVGPTVLNLMGIDIPAEMTGRDLQEGAGS